jgi:predicted GNAT family N-acyltransferase
MLLIDKLQKENSNAVGFIQKTIWEKYVFGGERNFVVLICESNADAVGYVLITPGKQSYSYAKIQQIAVRNDARRLYYGTALLDVCRQFCEKFNRTGFTLRCRQDLDSNYFWKSLGFEKYATWEKGKINHVGFKASNDINLWKIDLNKNIIKLF